MQATAKAHLGRIILCFAAIYLIWGSTYLAIKYAIDSIPPFVMSGSRFLVASLILIGIGLSKKERLPDPEQRRLAIISGILLVLANAMVSLAEKWVSTGRASVIVGTVPVWIIILQWAFFNGMRPTLKQVAGIAASLLGIVLLTTDHATTTDATNLGSLLLFGSVISWSFGTLIQRKVSKGVGLFTFSGYQLFSGGLCAVIVGLIFERPSADVLSSIEMSSLLAFAYLVVFGSVVAFSAYIWLGMHVEPSKLSTYALVNPLVAVWLGWSFNSEPAHLNMIFASLLIIGGLYFVLFKKQPALVQAVATDKQ